MKRLYNLDYLRGLAATGIMIYHYCSWTYGDYGASTILGRIGLYGVSVFYILSGLTLFYVYRERMKPDAKDIIGFFKKRFFRIYPLLCLVTLIAVALSRHIPDIGKLLLNLSGLFGFVQWDQYYAVGAWSIGNELVFYIFLPVFFFLVHRSKLAFTLFSVTLFAIYLYFAFYVLNTGGSITDQWKNYVNPLNQVFLFLSGFLIGLLFLERKIHEAVNIALLVCGVALFIFYPVKDSTIYLVTGAARLVFTLSCLMIALAFFKTGVRLPSFLDKALSFIGEASYSIYLLHPIVFAGLGFCFTLAEKHLFHMPVIAKLLIGIILTIFISYFVYEKFEKYFMRLSHTKKAVTSPGI